MIEVFIMFSEMDQIFKNTIFTNKKKNLPFVLDLSLPLTPELPYPHAAHLPYNYGVFFPLSSAKW